jgi:hypothetical protein
LFGTSKESKLTKEQSQILLQTLESKATWFIKQYNATSGIFSSKYKHRFDVSPGTETVVCCQCLRLKKRKLAEKGAQHGIRKWRHSQIYPFNSYET